MKRLFAVMLFAASAFAEPKITGVSPNSGSVSGGTVVTISGTGFEFCPICSPPLLGLVMFGSTPVRDVALLEDGSIRVTAPAHLPQTVDVQVHQWNGKASLPDAFTFTGKIEDGFHQVLLPLFTPTVHGAFGSEFVTELRLMNAGDGLARVYGLTLDCRILCPPLDPLEVPLELLPGRSQHPFDIARSGKPGQFLFIPKNMARVTMNLRVFDQTRDEFNFGTELPIVPVSEFTNDRIVLLGVPGDPRFRNTLRIYATAETSVTVSVDDIAWHVPLTAGENELYPAYAQFSGLPVGDFKYDVTIVPAETAPPLIAPKVWAFISVTNNDTQLITTISPQPN